MTKKEVFALCSEVAPKFGLDPLLVLAICERESTYNPDEIRLENGFYRKYVRPQKLPPSAEVLLSASYGLMQVMGQVLVEIGYIKLPGSLGGGMVADQLDAFIASPYMQVGAGCTHFLNKLHRAKNNLRAALQFWNGGGNPNYASEVIAIHERLKGENRENW
jgi:hypothetical protein